MERGRQLRVKARQAFDQLLAHRSGESVHSVQILKKLQRVILNVSEIFEQLRRSWCGEAANTNSGFRHPASKEVKQSLSPSHFEIMPGGRRHNYLKTFAFQPSFNL